MLRNPKKYGVWSALVLAGLLIGCSPSGSAPDASSEGAAAEVQEARAAAKREIRNQIDDLETQIAKVKQDASQAGREMKDTWNQSINDLEKRTEDLRMELDSLQDKGDDAWNAFSQRAKRAIDEIKAGLKEAADELR